MFLILFILIVAIFFYLIPSYAKNIANYVGTILYPVLDEEMNLRSEVLDLKSEQNRVSMTEEFAKYMKLQRSIDKLTEKVKVLGSSRSQKKTLLTMVVKIAIYIVHAITMVTLILLYRNDPLLLLPPGWFSPVQKIIAFPTGVPGGVGVTCWIVVCSTVIPRIHRLMSVFT
ncbi:hypothetical protein ScPMuIL_013372 [Solemya velum]